MKLTVKALESSYVDLIKEDLLNGSSFYAQMSLKYGDDKEKEKEQLDLSQKYYDALEWFNSITKANEIFNLKNK